MIWPCLLHMFAHLLACVQNIGVPIIEFDTQLTCSIASAATHLLHSLRLSSGKVLTSLEHLLQPPCWQFVKKEWKGDSWCGAHISAKGGLRRQVKMLKLASVLPRPVCKRIEDCFSTLEVGLLHQDTHTDTPTALFKAERSRVACFMWSWLLGLISI